MRLSRFSVLGFFIIILMASQSPIIDASSTGKHNSSGGCSCHYNTGALPAINHNFPLAYSAGQTYSITISLSAGSAGGFSVAADKGSFSNAGTGVSINGASVTHTSSGSTSWTFDWVAPSVNSGTATIDMAGLMANSNGQNSGDGWTTDTHTITENLPKNYVPEATNVVLNPSSNAASNSDITVSYTYYDANGDPESGTEINWLKDGNIETSYFGLTTLPSSATTVGEIWEVTIKPKDGVDFGLLVESDAVNITAPTQADADGDGYPDSTDAFPNDSSEWQDTDGDGVGDNGDAFPNDATETLDSDSDGVGDNSDAFPNDASETLDSDGDTVGDNADAFPNDATETVDSDSDGVGDNSDVFPNDATETVDSDSDGVGDNSDAFPNDASETLDTDGDTVGDNADAFPDDASETLDTDMDGVGDNSDAFPNDASETLDTDMDGVGDNADAFPLNDQETVDTDGDGTGDNSDSDDDDDGTLDVNDAFPFNSSETTDSDSDGIGDNADTDDDGDGILDTDDASHPSNIGKDDTDGDQVIDDVDPDDDGDDVIDTVDAFPKDKNESMDSDGDGVGDNADAFDNDPTETVDTDGDMVGDNSDLYPNDPTESADTDDDGVADNADAFPNDASETKDSDGNGVGDIEQQASEDKAKQTKIILIVVLVLISGAVATVLFMRKGREGTVKDFSASQDVANNLVVDDPSSISQQPMMEQPTIVQPVVQPVVEPVAQPVAQPIPEPTVLQQWTDEAGYTWRSMSDGSMTWWTGTEWQKR